MRLNELAEELGKDPLEVMSLLLKSPKAFFVGSTPSKETGVDEWFPPTYDIYSIKIHSHLVEEAREFILKNTAQEVIDYVKEGGTEAIRKSIFEDDYPDTGADLLKDPGEDDA